MSPEPEEAEVEGILTLYETPFSLEGEYWANWARVVHAVVVRDRVSRVVSI